MHHRISTSKGGMTAQWRLAQETLCVSDGLGVILQAFVCLGWSRKFARNAENMIWTMEPQQGEMRNPQCKGTSAADEHVFVLTV